MTDVATVAAPQDGTGGTRLALASRGDALTPYLFDALERRFPVVGRIDPELTRPQRLGIAALTVRPSRSAWAERFYKSGTANRLRSGNARKQLLALERRPGVVVQVHALFDQTVAPSAVYVDCTHHQAAEFWPAWNPLRGRALQQWYRREQEAYAAAAHLFAFCEPTARSLIEEYSIAPEKVSVVGGGVNLPVLPAVTARPGEGPRTILFIGNDFVRKGGEVLLTAFRTVRRALPDARLVLVGTRPTVAPEPGVEVLGRIRDRERIAQLYREAAVFCLPSFFDPYPLVLLEAMAFGVPVVTTAQTGTPEIVTDGRTGRLVPMGEAAALAETLVEVLRDPDGSARLALAARGDVERRLTWDHVAARMAPALDALSAARR